MIRGGEVGVEGVGAGRVLAVLGADFEGGHLFVVLDLEGRVVEVLGLQGDVRHDVSVVDHSDYGWNSALEIHGEILVSDSGTAEGVNFVHVLVF